MAESYNKSRSSDLTGGGKNPQIIARVTKVVMGPFLSDGKTLDSDYEDITSIGLIRYVILNSTQYSSLLGYGNRPAKPFYSSLQKYPLENEYVYLLPGPGLGLNETAGDMDYYYIGPIKLWGSSHHNAFPDFISIAAQNNLNRASYEESTQGTVNSGEATTDEFYLGNCFNEKSNVKSIMPFTGDLIVEGRYGNSIRLGATARCYSRFNLWSDTGSTGDPITIIRNGQGDTNQLGYVPTVEDINKDHSSIYLTAGQRIEMTDLNNFPLTSWNVTIQSKIRTAITLTTPPTANEIFSAEQQDRSNETSPNQQTT